MGGSLLDGTADESSKKRSVLLLKAFGSDLAIDSDLLTALPSAVSKEPSARGTFDELVMKTMGEQICKHLEKTNSKLASDDEDMQQKATALETASKAVADAEEHRSLCAAAVGDAKQALKAAESATKEAKKNLAAMENDGRVKACEHAKKILTDFQEGALADFRALEAATAGTPGYHSESIEGLMCDSAILNVSRNASSDGKVTKEGAEKLNDMVKSCTLTQDERWTIRHCLYEFEFEQDAHDVIVGILKSMIDQPAKKIKTTKGYYVTIDGRKCDSAIIEACQEAVAGEGDGRVSVDDAKKIFAKIVDGQITDVERWTVKYCVCGFHWTDAALAWMHEQLKRPSPEVKTPSP